LWLPDFQGGDVTTYPQKMAKPRAKFVAGVTLFYARPIDRILGP
jgi:hypothetical protein